MPGGKLQEITAELQALASYEPTEQDIKAFGNLEKFRRDMRTTNYKSLDQRREDDETLAQLIGIARQAEEKREAREKRQVELKTQKMAVENEILDWQEHKQKIINQIQPQHEQRISFLEREIARTEYLLTRDRKAQLGTVEALDAEIERLKQQADHTPQEWLRLGLDLEIEILQSKRYFFLTETTQHAEPYFTDMENDIKKWDLEIKRLRNDLVEGQKQCDQELIKLKGESE